MALTSQKSAVHVVGRYAIYGEIAVGGMATIHLGRLLGPVGFSRTVAIKRLHPQYARDADFVSMFLDEARVAGRIQHPNVVQLLDVVASDAELFLVMEYVQGESLARLWRAQLAAREPFPLPIATGILAAMLHGLHAVHETRDERNQPLNVVHRDVSPQNVIVGVDGLPRLLDFGVSKAAGRLQTTREGQLKGKLPYMAPEQLAGDERAVTRQADIYSSAVVLWEVLTGQRLYDGENEARIFARVVEGRVPPPSHVVGGLPPALDGVVMRGLDRDPSRRFATAREMALALEACVRPAPSTEIGAWVEHLAGASLFKRAQQVAELESSSAVRIPVGGQPHIAHSSATAQSLAMAQRQMQEVPGPGGPVTMPVPVPAPAAAFTPSGGIAVGSGSGSVSVPVPMSSGELPPLSEPIVPEFRPSIFARVWPPNEGPATRSWSYPAAIAVPMPGPAAAPPTSSGVKILVAIATAALVLAASAVVIGLRVMNRPLPPGQSSAPVAAATTATTATPTPPPGTAPTAIDPGAGTGTPTGLLSPATSSGPAAASAAPAKGAASAVAAASASTAAKPAGKSGSGSTTAAHASSVAKPSPGAAKKGNCDPPYTRDANGVKIYKDECM